MFNSGKVIKLPKQNIVMFENWVYWSSLGKSLSGGIKGFNFKSVLKQNVSTILFFSFQEIKSVFFTNTNHLNRLLCNYSIAWILLYLIKLTDYEEITKLQIRRDHETGDTRSNWCQGYCFLLVKIEISLFNHNNGSFFYFYSVNSVTFSVRGLFGNWLPLLYSS